MSPASSASRQRGVALIIALVLMALATILAVKIGFGGYVERKRTVSILAAEQSFQFAMGAEALAADVLNQNTSNTDDFSQPWAQVPQPIPLRPPNDPEGEPLGTLEGSLEDLSGRFNINNLLRLDKDNNPDKQPLEQFEALLESLGLEQKWAELARDWIDANNNAGFPNGAEDSVYTSQTPPYRTGNWPMLSPAELMNLPGFGMERYQKLAPYITALPISDAKVNVCTASGLVLDSLTPGFKTFSNDPEGLARARKTGCFPTKTGFLNGVPPAQKQMLTDRVDEKSSYFRLTTIVTLGSTEFTLYSLLWRDQKKRITPILRSFGTP